MKHAARTWGLAAALLLPGPAALACSCFPPEVRARTANEALAAAQLAVLGRVVEVHPGGKATVTVVESFKGPAAGTTVEVLRDAGRCPAPAPLAVADDVLLVAFQPTVTACDKHAADHFFVEHFRAAQSRAKAPPAR